MHVTASRLVIAAAIVVVASASAEAQPSRAEAQRIATAISQDLGVSLWTFAGCARGVSSAPQVAAATDEGRAEARRAVLLPCLQKANPAITADMLDAAIARHRPTAPSNKG